MRKQIIKAFTMLIAIMMMALVTAVASASGQTKNHELQKSVSERQVTN